MTAKISFSPDHQAAITQLIDFSTRDPEGFRLQAVKAYAAFTPQARADVRALETMSTSAYTVFLEWEMTLRPLLQELEIYRLKPSFHKSIAKYLLLDTGAAAQTIDRLVAARCHELLTDFTNKLYACHPSKKDAKACAHAYKLFALPPRDIEALYSAYLHYLMHCRVAAMQSITITDLHAPWIKRRHALKKVSGERKKTLTLERNRLHTINQELEKLSKTYDGLVGKILEKDWDLIMVIGLRNQYEKQLQNLDEHAAKSPLKRLEIFENITKEFRDQQVEKMALADPSQNSLGAARTFAETIDSLLLQIFDLTNTQKNQLLVLTKEARELTNEKETILHYRSHRQQLLQKSMG